MWLEYTVKCKYTKQTKPDVFSSGFFDYPGSYVLAQAAMDIWVKRGAGHYAQS
jgi:hypothetical protein